MTERKVKPEPKKLDKAKEIIKNHWKPFTVGVIFTGVTLIVTKRVLFPDRNALLIKKLVIKDSILFFSTQARQQGPPSYLTECLETGEKWVSQTECAKAIGVSKSTLSQHLNGMRDHVNGLHYVRRAAVVPYTG